MANIIKASSGLLFQEEFKGDVSLLWDLNPNLPDRVTQNSDSISLLPGNKRLELLIPIPQESSYIMQSKIKYTPTTNADKAGITFKSVTDNYIDLQICGDDIINCAYTKMTVDDYGILTARVSNDGLVWSNYGNTKMTNTYNMGYYIDENSLNDKIDIYSCTVFKNDFVVLNNFDRLTYIKIFDENNNEVTDDFVIKKKNTKIILDCTDIIFPIKKITLRIYDRNTDALIHEGELLEIYGGDVYEYNYNLDFYINGTLLDDQEFNLGGIETEKIFNLTIENKEDYEIKDKTLSIEYYTLLNMGHRSVYITNESGESYSKAIKHINFAPGESKIFKLKILKDKTYPQIDENYKFNITLE